LSGHAWIFPDRTEQRELFRALSASWTPHQSDGYQRGWPILFVAGIRILGVGTVGVFVEVDRGVVTTGITGIVGDAVPGPATLMNGDTPGVGIVAQELTPRLAISQESSGIPARGLPPGVVGVVDMGVDGEVGGPLDPAPHIPDTPSVPIVEAVDIAAIGNVPGSVGAADGAEIPAICVPPAVVLVIAALPAVAAVAVATDPIAIPPPS
jgi:hypothetical protein